MIAFIDDNATPTRVGSSTCSRRSSEPLSSVWLVAWSRPGRLDRPRSFHLKFDWIVEQSYRGMPDRSPPSKRLDHQHEQFGVTCSTPSAVSGSASETGEHSLASQDTEACVRRESAVREGSCWVYPVAAALRVTRSAARERFQFFVERCFAEPGKADLVALIGRTAAISAEKSYARTVLPSGIVVGLAEALSGDPMGAARSGAIVVGLAAATAGLVSERWKLRSRRPGRPAVSDRPPPKRVKIELHLVCPGDRTEGQHAGPRRPEWL